MKAYKIGEKFFGVGKSKSSGKYVLIELPGRNRQEFDTFEELKNKMVKMKKNADKREYRAMIAEMSGTSYSAACRDMGLRPA